MAKAFLKQYEILFLKAKDDLVAAKYLLDGFNNYNLQLNLDIIFFHLQQCAEKLIKTLLDFNQIKFPYTHDIDKLIDILSTNNINTIENIKMLIPLTDFAVEGRYTVIHDDLEDVDFYIQIVNELLEFVQKTVK